MRQFIALTITFLILMLSIDSLATESSRLLPLEKNGQWGYVNESGNFVIKPRYLMAMEFTQDGIAAVVDRGSVEVHNNAACDAHRATGMGGAMERLGERNPATVNLDTSARVATDRGEAFALRPSCDLVHRNDRRAVDSRDFEGISNVIFVPVRQNDRSTNHFFGVVFRQRIAR